MQADTVDEKFKWDFYRQNARRKCQLFRDLQREYNLSDEVTLRLMEASTLKIKTPPLDKTETLVGRLKEALSGAVQRSRP